MEPRHRVRDADGGRPGRQRRHRWRRRQRDLDKPFSVAIDHINQELFVADKGNHRIRRVRVGGLVSQASANGTQLAVNLDARNVQDYVTTLAGSTQGYADGFGTAAKFSMPSGLAVDGHTRLLFVADTANYAIRKIDLTNGRVTTLAGSAGMPGFVNGRGEAASFAFPIGLALAMHSRQLYVCDAHNHALRVVHVITREVRTLAGLGTAGAADGTGASATFHLPRDAVVDDEEETVYVAEMSPRIRAVRTAVHPTYPLPPTGEPAGAALSPAVSTLLDGAEYGVEEIGAVALAYGWPGGALMFSDVRRHKIHRLLLSAVMPPPPPGVGADETNGTIAPPMPPAAPPEAPPAAVGRRRTLAGSEDDERDGAGAAEAARRATEAAARRVLQSGGEATTAVAADDIATISVCPQGVAAGELGAESAEECHPTLAQLVGSTPGFLDGYGINTRFYRPTGIAIDYLTQTMYVADEYNHRVRLVDLTAVPVEVVVQEEAWHELIVRALRQNFIFLLLLVSSTLGCCCCTYLWCRYCSCCPLYQRKLHKKRMDSMAIGSRAV